jgi:hypothetical protein
MALADMPDADRGDLFDAGGAPLTDHGAEELLLGYLLNKPGAVTEVLEIISAADLHDPVHRRIFEDLLFSYQNDAPLKLAPVVSKMAAALMAGADLQIDIEELASHLQEISERRAVGTVDDVDFSRGAPFVSKFGAQAWEDIGTAGAIGSYAWLVEDIIPLDEIAMAFGDTGTGKSFAIFDLGMCVARGIKFNGFNVEQGLVVYVAAEGGKGFAKRKIAYAIQHQLEPSEPLAFVLLTKRPDFFQSDADAVALAEEINQIKRRYRVPLRLTAIDTLSAVTPGMDENTGKDQSLVRRRLLMVREKCGGTIIVVHHKPKNGSSPRGHGSLTADIENTIEFETRTDKKTSDGKPIHSATVRKQREGKSGISWEFTLPVINVGRNKWGNPETTCVVQPYTSGGPKAPKVGFHATPTELLFMRSLYDALVDHGVPPPAGLPKSIGKVVHHKDIRAAMRAKMIEPHEDSETSDNRFRQAFKRAGDKLRDGAVIGVQSGLIWPTGKPVQGFDGTNIS